MKGKVTDRIGQVFGRLTVIKRARSDRHYKAMWLCKCECGTECVVVGANLKNGLTVSCGCLRSENMRRTTTERNERKKLIHL